MKVLRKRIKLIIFLLSFLSCSSKLNAQNLSWENIPHIYLGPLKLYWNVSDSSHGANDEIAKAHGFHGVSLLNTFADYPGNQEQNINKWMPNDYSDPWTKPPFFEKIIKRNIDNLKPNEIYVNDIEISFQKDPDSAQLSKNNRNQLTLKNDETFSDAYYKAMAEWFSLPLVWTKEKYPNTMVGLYGVQPFRRDYWGLVGKSVLEIDGAHKYDFKLWKYIEPYVDFYTSSVYLFYDTPDSYYYIIANIEKNFLETRKYGNKPVYAYEWLRYHSSNELLSNQEIRINLVEAMAILPFFSGAKGIILWGWEPQVKQIGEQPYSNLESYVYSLKRLEPLASIIDQGDLIIEESVGELWTQKKPIIRVIKDKNNNCVAMAVDPWQRENITTSVLVSCGNKEVNVRIKDNRISLISIKNGIVRYH